MLIPFSPPPGLNSDDTSFSAEGRWADGSNVRFVNGKPQVIGSFAQVLNLATASACRAILAMDRSGTTNIAYGFATSGAAAKLYVGTGVAAPTDVTPAGLTTASVNWSLATWGSTLLACPNGQTLYEQAGVAQAAAVAAAPDNITFIVTTAERQVLAFGCNEEGSGTFNSKCIRGCDIEDYTDWTTTSTNNAFEHILEGEGKIVTARIIGGYVAVWTDTALHLGQFIGDPGQTYRFEKISDNCGLAGPNAVAIMNQRAYWIGADVVPRTWGWASYRNRFRA